MKKIIIGFLLIASILNVDANPVPNTTMNKDTKVKYDKEKEREAVIKELAECEMSIINMRNIIDKQNREMENKKMSKELYQCCVEVKMSAMAILQKRIERKIYLEKWLRDN